MVFRPKIAREIHDLKHQKLRKRKIRGHGVNTHINIPLLRRKCGDFWAIYEIFDSFPPTLSTYIHIHILYKKDNFKGNHYYD